MINQLKTFALKRVRARQLGLTLWRSRDFVLPESLVLNGKRVSVEFPAERGVQVAFAELLLADCYGLEDVKYPVKTVLDIGANVGVFAIAARKAFPHAEIHSYEPNPYQEKYLKHQAKVTGAKYFMEAVEAEDAFVNLNFHDDSVQTSSQVDDSGSFPAVAFRKAVHRLGGSVDFAKVDCEGAEWRIWQDHATWQRVKYLSTEYHIQAGHTHDEARSMIMALGFEVLFQERAESFGVIRAIRPGN